MPPCCIEHARGSHEEDTAGVHKCSRGGWSAPGPDIRSKRDQVADDATKPRDSWHGSGLKNGAGCRAVPSEMVPYIGREDWEEKRQRLLVQKKQLEAERERLQARLAEQEERLLKQNQELRQSRLNHSKYGKFKGFDWPHVCFFFFFLVSGNRAFAFPPLSGPSKN